MSAQEQTIRQYHELMQLNAVSHVVRSGREVGILDTLADGQRTAEQLCQDLSLSPRPAQLLLDALVATGVIERYGDDYALSAAAQLLCQYDRDLGDARWGRLTAEVWGEGPAARGRPPAEQESREHFDAVAATQWIHTAAAMQAAEILDVGGEGNRDLAILDLGCGSGVWSCAMAYRAGQAQVTAVDAAAPLQAARRTAESIGLESRFEAVEADPAEVELSEQAFDLVLLAQRLHALGPSEGDRLLERAVRFAKPGGRVAVIDLFQSPGQVPLAERLAALRMQLETPAGRIPTLEETQQRLLAVGLTGVQFSFLAASREGLGIAVGDTRG